MKTESKILRIFTVDTTLEVLKWVIIVLLAGFIGQFGRTLSHYVMGYFKKRREKRIATVPSETHETKSVTTESLPETKKVKKEVILPSKAQEEKQQLKAEKKFLKAQLKEKKKLERKG
jgi:hypothetical protein